jgi:hypothetical protein
MREKGPSEPQRDDETDHSKTRGSSDRTGRPTRRSLLAGIGVAGLSTTAGCLTTLPAFGQRVRFGEVTEPPSGSPHYRHWVPDFAENIREQIDNPVRNTAVEYVEPGNRGEDLLGAGYGGDNAMRAMEYVGVDFEEFDWIVTDRGQAVARGTFDHTAVEETIGQIPYELDGHYRGFDLYRNDNIRRMIGVSDELLVFTGYFDDPHGPVERVIDAGAGRITRRHEVVSEFASLSSATGARPVVTISPSQYSIEGTEAVLEARTLTPRESDVIAGRMLLLPENHGISRSNFENHLAEFPEALEATRVDVSVEGRVATALGQLEPEVFLDIEDVHDRPLITWDASYDADAETVTVTHKAGDSIDADQLTITFVDYSTQTGNREQADTQFTAVTDRVGPGTEVTVDVAEMANWHLLIHGHSPDGDAHWSEFGYVPPELLENRE